MNTQPRFRIGYGKDRSERDFKDHDCRRLYIDNAETGRTERADMLHDIRAGQEVFLLSPGDLGRGKEVANIRAHLEAQDVALAVADAAPALPAHRPRKFDPDPEQDARIKALYDDRLALGMPHVVKRASEIVGYPVQRYHLIYRYKKEPEYGR